MKEAREFSVLGPLMGGFGSQAFLGCVHDQGMVGPVLKPAVFVFIPDEIVADAAAFRSLWLDTERAGEIDHVNVIGVMGVARLDEGYARVVEYADAESLRSVYRRAQTMKQPMSADIAVALVADACMGVHYAHELGEAETGHPWVHGGVRPETLQVSFAGMAKVTGYGAQVLADTFRKKGATGLITRDTYMAPEQAIGGRQSATVQSDVYALGCILYEALTGKPPFSGDKDLAEAMIKDELSRPSLGVTSAMAEVVLKATKKKASERYATALDMRMDLFERCDPANEGDVKRYLDDLFPPNAIPRATRIQMLRKANADRPLPTGRLLVEVPAELTVAHAARAATPNDADLEARTGQTVDDLPMAEADDLDAEPAVAAAAAFLVNRAMQSQPTTMPGSMPAPQPRSWQAVATSPPAPPAPSTPVQLRQPTPLNHTDELTNPTRRRQPILAALPPVQPPTQVVYSTPAGLLVGIGLLGGLVIALTAFVYVQSRPVSPSPAPAPAPVLVAPPPPVAAAPDPPPVASPAPSTATPTTSTTSTTSTASAGAFKTPAKPVATGPGTLTITSSPSLALTVDGKDVGEGSATLELPAGKHTVVGTGQGTTVRRAVTLKAGGKESVNLALEKGALAIDAPPGCDVIVDGKKVGRTPIEPIELFTGQHRIVVKQGVVEYKQTVGIRAGLEMVLSVSFHN